MGNRDLFSCKDCADRVIGCHSSCEKYLKAQQILKGIREAKMRENDIDDYTVSFILREKKKKRQRGKT